MSYNMFEKDWKLEKNKQFQDRTKHQKLAQTAQTSQNFPKHAHTSQNFPKLPKTFTNFPTHVHTATHDQIQHTHCNKKMQRLHEHIYFISFHIY